MQPISTNKLFIILIPLISLFSEKTVAYDTKKLTNQAIEENLHLHPQWIALNHYYSEHGASFQSEIDDPGFFLSKNGNFSTIDELKASIHALLDQSPNSNSHFICRYPARLKFFITQLQLDEQKFDRSHCPELNSWLSEHSSQTVSLIYPTSYLNNPSSVFGHTFLRFNRKGYEKQLGFAVDFSAIVDRNEGILSYIYKGFSGGYKGIYSIRPYYVKSWEYSDVENRKIWEYDLSLNEQQVHLILLHLWELRGKYINYYFADENCSYQILSLINVATPQLNFRQKFSATTIPADTVRYLIDRELVIQAEYIPPLELRYQHDIDSLSQSHQEIIQSFSTQPDTAFVTHSQTLVANPELINITTNYLYVQIQHGYIPAKTGFEVITKLNHLRIHIPVSDTKSTNIHSSDNELNNTHSSHRISAGVTQITNVTSTLFSYRPAYHDFTDPIDSFNQGSEINLMDTTLTINKYGLHIEEIKFLNLSSLQTDTAFSSPLAWRFNILRKRFYYDEEGELVNQANFYLGKAYHINDINLFALGQVGISYNSIQQSDFSFNTGLNLGALLQAEGHTVLLEYNNEQLNSTHNYYYHSLEISNSIKVSSRLSWNLSFMLTKTHTYDQREARSTLNYYF